MWPRRIETLLMGIPILLLLYYGYTDVVNAPPIQSVFKKEQLLQQQKMAVGAGREPSSNWPVVLYQGFILTYEYLVRTDGIGRLSGVVYLLALYCGTIYVSRQYSGDKYERRGADGGLIIGITILPIVFASQLYLHAHLGVGPISITLFWLSLCCSTIAFMAALTGNSVSDADGPGLTELFTTMLLAQMALAIQDVMMSADTLLACLLFSYILHFLLHTLRFSFTSGEAVTVATMVALMLTHAIFSFVSHLFQFYLTYLHGSSPLNRFLSTIIDWCERAHILDISFAARLRSQRHPNQMSIVELRQSEQHGAFYNALITLHVGVLLIGLIWFPFAIRLKRARTRQRRLERAVNEIDLKVEQRDEDQQHHQQTQTNGYTNSAQSSPTLSPALSPSPDPPKIAPSRMKRRKVASSSTNGDEELHPLVPATSSSSTSVTSSLRSRPNRLGSAPKAAPFSHPPAISAYSAPIVWLLLILTIFCFLWPYIALEMGQEPFMFILRYLISIPESTSDFHDRRQAERRRGESIDEEALPPALMFEALHSGQTINILGMQIDYSFATQNIRAMVIVFWLISMAIGVVLFAPAGKAGQNDPNNPSSVESTSSTSPRSSITPTHASLRTEISLDFTTNSPITSRVIVRPNRSGCSWHPSTWPNILVRKWYHFLAVWLFVPAIVIEPGFVALSFAVASSIFMLVEYIRISRLPPIGDKIHQFMKSYLDIRDSGIVILTHAYLLIGCALPLWLHLHVLVDDDEHIVDSSFDSNLSFMSSLLQSSKYRSQAYAHYDSNNHRQLTWDMSVYLPAMCGVLVLGIGDSMASLVGVWVGRLKWFNINRTVEGTAAAITSIMGFTYCMVRGFQFVNEIMLGGSLIILDPNWTRLLVSTILTCLLEAFTLQIDNLFLPLFYYATMILIGV